MSNLQVKITILCSFVSAQLLRSARSHVNLGLEGKDLYTRNKQLVGLMFAPNISHAKGFWELEAILSNYSSATETAIQMTLGLISIMLCICSMLLLVGAFCNIPTLILVYQYGALVYSGTVFVLFFILAIFCFFVHSNCGLAGGVLCALILVDVLITAYFIIVANSLRVSITFLRSDAYKSVV